MLSPFSRALVYYVGGAFVVVLFGALWYLDRPTDLDTSWRRRLRRRAAILVPVGVLHPMIALTAFGLARDAARDADPSESRSVLIGAVCSLVVSLVGMAAVLVTVE